MKNIYFAFAFAFALLAFFACSPDGGSGGKGGPNSIPKSGACYLEYNLAENYADMCMAGITESVTRSDCKDLESEIRGYTVKYQTSCPSGQDYKCYIDDEGEGFVYLYGSSYNKNSCSQFGGELVAQSSNSKASSSSKGSIGGTSSTGSTGGSKACYSRDAYENFGDGLPELPICFEGNITRSDCDDFSEMLYDAPVSFQNSCPSRSRDDLTCTISGFNGVYIYVYGETVTDYNLTCSDFGWNTATTNKSSSSAGSTKSSSSGTTTTSGACHITSTNGYNFAACIQPMSRTECTGNEDGIMFSYVTSCPTGACDVDYDDYDGTTYYSYGDLCKDDFCDIYPEYCDDDDYWDYCDDMYFYCLYYDECDDYYDYCVGGYGLKAKKLPKKGLLKAKGLSKAKSLPKAKGLSKELKSLSKELSEGLSKKVLR